MIPDKEKTLVRSLFKATENCNEKTIEDAIKPFVTTDFIFKGKSLLILPYHAAYLNYIIPYSESLFHNSLLDMILSVTYLQNMINQEVDSF